ncbi:nicotinate-nucleotide adenylyltransferase [Bosea sp. AS-1]|jgi:nicotinate-nucleotide adenylyltransferase|uniref:nicotinate-nucleotide adenylyltransferase n=1 Tax=Bosea sp. AS-1 TaxID=2015316 RepID=UPI000B776CE4|nr:nicotinate-nucleotide adenylyltransferase [Bosea sp. AS-1]
MANEHLRLPPHAPGLCIGLFGGSFNPAHDGHRLASLTALRRLQLDKVWWLVTPGNPLKDNTRLPPLPERIRQARSVANSARIHVTGIEARLRTRYTADTLRALKRRCPGVRFVWIMGSDNLASFHRWNEWRAIARMMPIAIIDRPGSTHSAMASPAANWLSRWRIPESQAATLARTEPPAWVFLHGRRSALSSTMLREQAGRD